MFLIHAPTLNAHGRSCITPLPHGIPFRKAIANLVVPGVFSNRIGTFCGDKHRVAGVVDATEAAAGDGARDGYAERVRVKSEHCLTRLTSTMVSDQFRQNVLESEAKLRHEWTCARQSTTTRNW